MSTIRKPRDSSLQYWPRKRAHSEVARVRTWANINEAKLLGFAGYKAGMTHMVVNDNRPKSGTKGQSITIPITVVECPPLKVAGVVLYTKKLNKLSISSHILYEKNDKELGRKIALPKKVNQKIEDVKPEQIEDLRLLVYTQPKMIGIGKKKPVIFEIAIGGKKEDKINFAKEKLGKEITINEVFTEGNQVDVHSVTKGKGLAGPVKRHGIGLKSHRSEKGRRAAVLGSEGDAKVRFYSHQSGQCGYHMRTEYNKWLIKIGESRDVNPKGGFIRYGETKNNCVLLKGSVGGATKRLIRFNHSIRPSKKIPKDAPAVEYISKSSRQGR